MAAETLDAIQSDIKQRKFAPVYFFCGEEAYFIDELTDLLEANVLSDMEKAFNQTIAYGKDFTVKQLLETCGRLPMMAEKQLVIVKEAQALALKQEEELLVRYLKNPIKSTVLVFAWKHGTPDGRKAFGKEIKKEAVYFESKALFDNQVAAWVKKWLTGKKLKIDEPAAELLIESIGKELSKITNELEKLALNKQAGATITLDDIETGIGISKDYNVFELNNALGLRDKTKAFKIANYFAANPKSGPLVMVVATLQGFFNKVYLASINKGLQDKDLAAAIKVSPYHVKDYKAAAKNYGGAKIEQIFYVLEEYDLRGKGVNNHQTKESELLREMIFRIIE